MTTLDSWTATVCEEFGIDPAAVDVRRILEVARDVAHQVDRPAAPVTAYLLGLAVGGGTPAGDATARVVALASGWQAAEADPPS